MVLESIKAQLAKDDSNSIVAQRQLILRYLDSEPSLASLPRIAFCDDGFSGTNFSRPDFQRRIDLIRAGEISTVVVKDLSRYRFKKNSPTRQNPTPIILLMLITS